MCQRVGGVVPQVYGPILLPSGERWYPREHKSKFETYLDAQDLTESAQLLELQWDHSTSSVLHIQKLTNHSSHVKSCTPVSYSHVFVTH